MILPNSYETILDKIKQDWFTAGWEAGMKHSFELKSLVDRTMDEEFSIKETIEDLSSGDNRYVYYEAGDVDWGTSDSDCPHKNFPCEHCGANLGEAWEEGF